MEGIGFELSGQFQGPRNPGFDPFCTGDIICERSPTAGGHSMESCGRLGVLFEYGSEFLAQIYAIGIRIGTQLYTDGITEFHADLPQQRDAYGEISFAVSIAVDCSAKFVAVQRRNHSPRSLPEKLFSDIERNRDEVVASPRLESENGRTITVMGILLRIHVD